MKKSQHKFPILVFGIILLICLILFVIPFFWKNPVFKLLKSDLINGYYKARIIQLYRPAPAEIIREHVHLYNGGFKPDDFRPGPVMVHGKGYNYKDSLGLILTKDLFEYAAHFHNGLAVVGKDSRYGMLSRKGKMVLHTEYDTLIPVSDVIVTVQGNSYGVADRRGHFRIPLSSRQITNNYDGFRLPFLLAVGAGGSFTVIDGKGREKDRPAYDRLDLRDDVFFVSRAGKWGAIDANANELVPVLYDRVDVYGHGYFTVRLGDREGLHRAADREPLIPVQYDKVDLCTPTTFRFMTDGHYGLLDRNAAVLIEPVYDTIYFHHAPEWIITGDHQRYAMRNTKDLKYPSAFYNWIGPCRKGMTVVSNDKGYGVLSVDGNEVVPPQYDSISNYNCGVAIVLHDNQLGAIDQNGVFVIPFSLSLVELYDFQCDLALAAQFNMMTSRIRKQYGFIDKKGHTVIPFIYEDGHRSFSNGLAGMKMDGAWGFIDIKGKKVIPFLYDTVSQFSDGRAQVVYQGRIIIVDQEGRTIE